MAQFDVYKNENHLTNQKVPYLLDVQNDILKSLNTRVVIPLIRDLKGIQGLTKEFVINDEKVYLTTAQMGAVYIDELKEKVTSLENIKEEIKNSIDFLIYGFWKSLKWGYKINCVRDRYITPPINRANFIS